MLKKLIRELKNADITINELIRKIWEIDKEIKATAIIREYYRTPSIKIPPTFSIAKKHIVLDFQKYKLKPTDSDYKKHGLSNEDIRELRRYN